MISAPKLAGNFPLGGYPVPAEHLLPEPLCLIYTVTGSGAFAEVMTNA